MKTSTLTRRAALTAAAAAVSLATVAGLAPAAVATPIPNLPEPAPYGRSFQSDPGHDFTKGIKPRRDSVLRGWFTVYRAGTAEYVPVRYKRGKHVDSFVAPPEGDVTAYAAPIARNVVFLSAYGCDMTKTTMDKRGVGTKRCSRAELLKRIAKGQKQPSLIWTVKGRIVKVAEIFTS
ncbi:hypothetical protein SAMN05421505_13538 [Sinosporangium album]|uniref:Uncharacterized protein n=1 Tax=Sinosporangium album TaxID=504805 RepID=A0A1G8I5C5_9ACTN|nr:hypothetical protein [Sinosporangium album]SDI14138.1 hypothetical protein SAMN05421505_13538 [Sinosporangium album]